jgi:hypothetical protein
MKAPQVVEKEVVGLGGPSATTVSYMAPPKA